MSDKQLPEADYRGKVRDLFFIDEKQMLIRASDRISAFDVIFNETIPGKGAILNEISSLWFSALRESGLQSELDFEDQIITSDPDGFPEPFRNHPEFVNRSVLVRRTRRVDFECVVRGYLAGSGWKDYQTKGGVCGIALPDGLKQAQKLPEPIFTPATKAALGDHDENVSFERMQSDLGTQSAERLRELSIAIYKFAAAKMESAGILLADTKFEFGLDPKSGRIVLIDEALTPDSSRYWNIDSYQTGTNPPGYDKQFIRDYVAATGWNKQPPPPALAAEVIEKTIGLYTEIRDRIRKILA